jgi:hypothetical protein
MFVVFVYSFYVCYDKLDQYSQIFENGVMACRWFLPYGKCILSSVNRKQLLMELH